MPLSEQESRCIELACGHLTALCGGVWTMVDSPSLDDVYPSERTPEVLVGNGSMTAASSSR